MVRRVPHRMGGGGVQFVSPWCPACDSGAQLVGTDPWGRPPSLAASTSRKLSLTQETMLDGAGTHSNRYTALLMILVLSFVPRPPRRKSITCPSSHLIFGHAAIANRSPRALTGRNLLCKRTIWSLMQTVHQLGNKSQDGAGRPSSAGSGGGGRLLSSSDCLSSGSGCLAVGLCSGHACASRGDPRTVRNGWSPSFNPLAGVGTD